MEGVGYRYRTWPALENVTMRLEDGEFLVVSGPSGAGKTTLLRLMWMDMFPDSGALEVAGFRADRITRGELPLLRRKLGIVFQDFRLLPDRTVYDNVALPLQVAGTAPRMIRRRVFEMLAEMGLSHRRISYPHELSGGEQQRIAIARAMVAHPEILLADEPTGNLDPRVSRMIVELLLEINRGGTAVVMATHDPRQIPEGAARMLFLDRGRLRDPGYWPEMDR
jgi:cell division transport system ATP-binding protein